MEFPDNGKEFVSISLTVLSIYQKSSKPSLPPCFFLQENLANEKSLGSPRLFFASFNSLVPNVPIWRRLLCVPSHAVLHAVPFLGPLGVVEAVQRAHQIAGDAADALKGHVVLVPAAAGALVPDDAGTRTTCPLSASAASPAIWWARWTASTTPSGPRNGTA